MFRRHHHGALHNGMCEMNQVEVAGPMPPFKQPKSLRGGCVARVALLVSASCLRLHSEPDRVKDGTETLRRHLLSFVSPLADEICAHILKRNKRNNLGAAGETILKVFTQRRSRTLRYLDVGNLNGEFWKSCVPSAPNLVELDLSSLVYVQRHMLLAITDHCRRLRAIFLPFVCVTTEDFCLLERIETLRVVENRCVHESTTNRSHKFGYGYKRSCMTRLVARLPQIEYIDCNCMGVVLKELSQDRRFPSLRYCWEMEPTRRLVETIAETCPNLDHLVLGNFLHSDCEFDLAPLAESLLRVSTLMLYNCSFDASMEEFLRGKGTFLRSLELGKIPEIRAEQLRTIGKHCRHLRRLVIYLRASPGIRHEDSEGGSTTYEVNEPVFESLCEFNLSADERSGKSYVGLLACLAHATGIQAIVFKEGASVGSRVESGLESCLSDLIGHNPMSELKSVIIRGRSLKLSKEVIKQLHDLPKIKTLTLKLNHEKETSAYLDQMKSNVVCNNLDIKLNY